MEVTPQSKFPNVFKYINISVHAIGAVHFCFGCYYDWVYVQVPKEVLPIYSAFSNKLKFLTYWDAILQAVYFTVCVVNDLRGSHDKVTKESTTLCKIKDFMFCSMAFPLAMFVGAMFWGLMAVDRELVLPKVLDPYFPWWLNHVMHTNIVVFQILDLVTCSREYPKRLNGFLTLVGFQTLYLSWMHVVYYKSGLWVYPIFNVLNIPQRILFIGASYCGGFVFYLMGEKLNKLLWGK